MTDLDHELSRMLDTRAGQLQPGPPPIEQLLDAGRAAARRQRHRQAWVALGAVAAVAAVIVLPGALVHGHQHAAPPPPAASTPPRTGAPTPTSLPDSLLDLPQGPGPTTPYLHGHTLVVDGHDVPVKIDGLKRAGTTVLLDQVRAGRTLWSLYTADGVVPLAFLSGASVDLSPDGRTLVAECWPDKTHTRIATYDVGTLSPVAHVDLDAPFAEATGGGQQVTLLGVDASRRTFWIDGNDGFVWSAGQEPRRIVLPSGWELDGGFSPAGPIAQGPTDRYVGSVSADGVFHPLLPIGIDPRAWSPDGKRTVAVGAGVEVIDLRTGSRTPLVLPAGSLPMPIAWTSDTTILLIGHDPQLHDHGAGLLLRCQADTGRCERALDLSTHGGYSF